MNTPQSSDSDFPRPLADLPPSDTQDTVRPSTTAPAVRPPRWSGRKTAVAAALAIGVAAVGATAATAAAPDGSLQMQSGHDRMHGGPHGDHDHQGGPGGPMQGGQMPGQMMPGGQMQGGQMPQQGQMPQGQMQGGSQPGTTVQQGSAASGGQAATT